MAKNRLFLAAIIILAGVLRLAGLGTYPAGFTPDEAAFGYNAESLLTTGRDEWGIAFWQLPFTNLRSFGDYKLPLYAFLTVPPVAVFGLTEAAVRLPNAVLGTLAVAVIYILCRKLKLDRAVSLLSALLLAVSPWAIPLSRGAFEANLITVFLPLALVLYFSRRYLLFTFFCSLILYTYHSARIIVPLSLLGLLLVYRPRLNISVSRYPVILILLSLPAVYSLVFANARAADISVFHPDDNWAAMATHRLQLISSGWPGWAARLAANKLTSTFPVFAGNYLSYFSCKFWFSGGPAEATYGMLPGVGVLYLIQLPFLLIFLYLLVKIRHRSYYYLLLLLAISPIPAALAKGPGFAANRDAFMVIPLTIMTAAGAGFVIAKYHKNFFRLLILLILISSGNFIGDYISKSPLVHSRAMGYGWQAVIGYLKQTGSIYDRIRISRSLSEPHIYLAFYDRIPPVIYQLSAASWPDFRKLGFSFLDQYDGYTLGKYRFGDLDYGQGVSVSTLYIGRPSDFPEGTRALFVSDYPDGSPAIMAAEKLPASRRLGEVD